MAKLLPGDLSKPLLQFQSFSSFFCLTIVQTKQKIQASGGVEARSHKFYVTL